MSNIKIKIQIFTNGHSAFGPGKADLLEAILNHGSISAAAKNLNMSYKRAWDLVDAMNKGFKEDLVVSKIGGSRGGGTQVTEFGLEVLRLYRDAIKKSHVFVEGEMSELMSHLNHE